MYDLVNTSASNSIPTSFHLHSIPIDIPAAWTSKVKPWSNPVLTVIIELFGNSELFRSAFISLAIVIAEMLLQIWSTQSRPDHQNQSRGQSRINTVSFQSRSQSHFTHILLKFQFIDIGGQLRQIQGRPAYNKNLSQPIYNKNKAVTSAIEEFHGLSRSFSSVLIGPRPIRVFTHFLWTYASVYWFRSRSQFWSDLFLHFCIRAYTSYARVHGTVSVIVSLLESWLSPTGQRGYFCGKILFIKSVTRRFLKIPPKSAC